MNDLRYANESITGNSTWVPVYVLTKNARKRRIRKNYPHHPANPIGLTTIWLVLHFTCQSIIHAIDPTTRWMYLYSVLKQRLDVALIAIGYLIWIAHVHLMVAKPMTARTKPLARVCVCVPNFHELIVCHRVTSKMATFLLLFSWISLSKPRTANCAWTNLSQAARAQAGLSLD